MEGLWSLMTVVAPILLAAAIIWAIIANKKRSRASVNMTERATHDQYKQPDGSHADPDKPNA